MPTVPVGLRPAVVSGVPLSTLAAQVGAVVAEGNKVPDLRVTGVKIGRAHV